MKRIEPANVIERNTAILERIKSLKMEHPFWGYRRIWAYLKYVDKLDINKKRILRLMQKHDLLVKSRSALKATRVPQKSKPRPDKPNQWWGIDMTKVMVQGFGWVYVTVVLDWYTKKVVGHYAGLQCRARHWLEALDMAVNTQFPYGARYQELSLMSDNGCQPTSISFMRSCSDLGIKQAFTSYNNPKGNADTERFFRTMKEELLWLREWTNPMELIDEVGEWIQGYNESYLHSSLGYKTPNRMETEYKNSQLLHNLRA
jgi:transposase InsO family protein